MNPLYNFMNSKPARILRHRARKIVIMPAQWRIRPTVAVGALSIVTSVWSVAGTAPAGTPDSFLRALQEFQSAETQEKSGQTASAVGHYQSAAKLLEQLSKSNPDWQHDIVEYRLHKSREGVERLGKPGEQGVTSNATANSPAGNGTAASAPATSNVGKTLPLTQTITVQGESGQFFVYPGDMVTVIEEDIEKQMVKVTYPGAIKPLLSNNDILGLADTTRKIRVCRYLNTVLIPGKPMNGGFMVPRMHRRPTGDEPDVPSTSESDEEEMIGLINKYRQSKGLTPLVKQASLTRSARIHCARMLQYGYSSPTAMLNLYPQQDMSAEMRIKLYAPNGADSIPADGLHPTNGTELSPKEVLNELLRPWTLGCGGKPLDQPRESPAHSDLNRPEYRYIGIGKIGDQWCIDFGT